MNESEAWNDLGGQRKDTFSSMSLDQLEAMNRMSPFQNGGPAHRALLRQRNEAANEITYGLTGKVERTPEQDEAVHAQAIDAMDVAIDALAQRNNLSENHTAALKMKRSQERDNR